MLRRRYSPEAANGRLTPLEGWIGWARGFILGWEVQTILAKAEYARLK